MLWISLIFLYCVSTIDAQSFPYNYVNVTEVIINEALTYAQTDNLAYMCDQFGPRYRGTEGLDKALDWIHTEMKAQGLENVHREKVRRS
jgi:hypothetical protein